MVSALVLQPPNRPFNNDDVTMLSTKFRACLGAILIAVAGLAASPAAAQNPHGKIFGDWRVRCNPATGAPAECQIFQNVVVKDTGQPILQAVVGFLDNVATPVGVFTLPLGIYLPPGLTLQVDKGQTYEMAIEICGRNGCRVRFSIDDKLLGTFKSGKIAEVAFYGGNRKAIKIPVSLKGFTAALAQIH